MKITNEHLHEHLITILANQDEIKAQNIKTLKALSNDKKIDVVIKQIKKSIRDLKRTPTK